MGKTKDSIKLLTEGINWCKSGICYKCHYNIANGNPELKSCYKASVKEAKKHLKKLRITIDAALETHKAFGKEEKPMVFGGFIICQECRKAYKSAEGHVCETKTPPLEEDKVNEPPKNKKVKAGHGY